MTRWVCKICGKEDIAGSTCTPLICGECARSQQCIYCGRERADSVFYTRRKRWRDFYMSVKNLPYTDELERKISIDRKTQMSEEYHKETLEMIDKRYPPLDLKHTDEASKQS